MSYVFVTGYVDLHALENRPGTKDNNRYFAYAEPLLRSGQRIVCFADPIHRPAILDLAGSNKRNVTVIDFTSRDLAYDQPWFFSAELPSQRNQSKDTHWYLAVNHQKPIWVKDAISMFDEQRYFCWIDFGINHVAKLSSDDFRQYLNQFRLAGRDELIVPALHSAAPAAAKKEDYLDRFITTPLMGGLIAGDRDFFCGWLRKRTAWLEY